MYLTKKNKSIYCELIVPYKKKYFLLYNSISRYSKVKKNKKKKKSNKLNLDENK